MTPRSLHRALAWRLALAASALATVLGSYAYLSIRDQFVELVSAVATVSTARINTQLLPLLDNPAALDPTAAQAQLDRLGKEKIARLTQGHYLVIWLLDLAGRPLASLQDNSDPSLAQAGATWVAQLLPGGESRAEFVRLDGWPCIVITQPLTDSRNQPVLRITAVFAASPEALAAYRGQIARTLLFAVGIVLATALLLYPLMRNLLDRVLGLSQSLLMANLDTIGALGGAVAKRDSDTDDHNYRVSLYCIALAEALALPKVAIVGLIKGAFLHDVGKIGIHDQILLKPGRLDAEEFMEMKKHVDYGLDIVKHCRWLADAVDVVGSHHEKYDGSGYPAGLQGDSIPLNARIFAVTDVFDALTSRRPYKEPLTLARSLEILGEGQGAHFDPVVVEAFAVLAPQLYARYGDCPPDQLKREMQGITARYFV